ncbi:MAG: hypothetical protein GQ468_02805 [Candidatus Scalindua sp.]|nr:hypothetical protein [Candidatus Scalindua sp.]
MIIQRKGEARLDYLVRVLDAYMDNWGDETIDYDGVTCDGACLAEDIRNAVSEIEYDNT